MKLSELRSLVPPIALQERVPIPFENLPASIKFKLSINWIAYLTIRIVLRIISRKEFRDKFFTVLKRQWDNFLTNSWQYAGKSPSFEGWLQCHSFDEFIAFYVDKTVYAGSLCIKNVFRPKLGQIVIDAGAHIGEWTIYAAKHVGSTGKVVAIEPHPLNVIRLKRNLRLNDLQNVVVCQVALGKDDGRASLYESQYSWEHSIVRPPTSSSGRIIEVPLRRLDSLIRELGINWVDWIIMNIEGAEYDALLGSINLLRECKPKIVLQAHGKDNLTRVVPFLEGLGYSITTVLRHRATEWGEGIWILACSN